jgi:hypothetical protein
MNEENSEDFLVKVSAFGPISDQNMDASTNFMEDFRVSLRLLLKPWYFSVLYSR